MINKLEKDIRVLTAATLVAGAIAGCGGETGKNRNTLLKATPTPAVAPADEEVVVQMATPLPTAVSFWPTPIPTAEVVIVPTIVEVALVLEPIRAGAEVFLSFPEVTVADVYGQDVYSAEGVPEVTLEARFTPVNLDGSAKEVNFIPAVSQDLYGNQWLWVDSGYRDLDSDGHWDPLPFEGVRFEVQGGQRRSKRGGEFSFEETQERLNEFIGKEVVRWQDGKEMRLVVRNVLIVPNEAMGDFASWSGRALDDAIALDPSFEYYKTQRGEFYVSCLRLPPEEEDEFLRSGGHQFSWMRLVLALVPAGA